MRAFTWKNPFVKHLEENKEILFSEIKQLTESGKFKLLEYMKKTQKQHSPSLKSNHKSEFKLHHKYAKLMVVHRDDPNKVNFFCLLLI